MQLNLIDILIVTPIPKKKRTQIKPDDTSWQETSARLGDTTNNIILGSEGWLGESSIKEIKCSRTDAILDEYPYSLQIIL